MTHQNFIHRFIKTPLMKYNMTLERMIQAHNYSTCIRLYDFFWLFTRTYEKNVPFANKRY
jgi:hypothetical protein